MHICFLTHEYPLPKKTHGGIGNFVYTLAVELVKFGHQVTVVGNFSDKEEVIDDNGIKIHLTRPSTWKFGTFYDNSNKLNLLLHCIHYRSPIDIIESPELGFAFIKKIPDIKYVIRLHGGHHFFAVAENKKTHWWKVLQEKRSFQKADEFIAVSHYVAKSTRALLAIRKNIKVIYNSINVYRFPKADPEKASRNELLFFGTVCEKKGIKQLVQAMSIVKDTVPNVHLNIAGRDKVEGGKSYINYLKTLIDPSVANQVSFMGEISHQQIPALLNQAEICILPSHMEAMGIAWLEALAMGKPFIGSKMGPGHEIVFDGKTGLLADPFDPKDLAEKIIYLLTNKARARELGEAARMDVLQRFDLNKTVFENIRFYSSILGQQPVVYS